MDKYNVIIKALEELTRVAYLNHRCTVEFRTKSLNDYHFYDPVLFPAIMVKSKIGEGFILEDMTLSISLFLDGNHDKESRELFEKLKESKIKEYFYDFPDSFVYGPINANVGNDIHFIAGLVIQIIYLLEKSRDFEITPEFHTYLELKQKESLDKLSVNPNEISIAIKNAFETGLTFIDKTSICLEILRERIDDYDFLGDIVINENNDGGYQVFIHTSPFENRPLDLTIRKFKQFHGISFIESCNISNNSFEIILTFHEKQKEAFLQLIAEIFKEFNPSLQNTEITAQLKYHNFISNPTVCLQYVFHSNGSGPTEKELKYGRLLIENLEIEMDEDDYNEMDPN